MIRFCIPPLMVLALACCGRKEGASVTQERLNGAKVVERPKGDLGELQSRERKLRLLSQENPEAAADALFRDPSFYGLRGGVSEAALEEIAPFLSTALNLKVRELHLEIEEWMAAHANDDSPMKLPLTEGSIFVSFYEAPRRMTGCGKAEIEGEIARIPVTFEYGEPGEPVLCSTETAIYRREGGRWRLDDVVFEYGDTLRDRLTLAK